MCVRPTKPLMTDVPQILARIEHGDPTAAGDLLPLVYDELRRLAARRLSAERPGLTLQPTALVHEAYLRLVGTDGDRAGGRGWNGRGHFFAAAAEAMRRILVERARRAGRLRHGGGRRRVDLDAVGAGPANPAAEDRPADDLLALDAALARLAAEHPAAAEVVKLRYFAGLTVEQAAEATGVNVGTAHRHWAYAKAWLYDALNGPGKDQAQGSE